MVVVWPVAALAGATADRELIERSGAERGGIRMRSSAAAAPGDRSPDLGSLAPRGLLCRQMRRLAIALLCGDDTPPTPTPHPPPHPSMTADHNRRPRPAGNGCWMAPPRSCTKAVSTARQLLSVRPPPERAARSQPRCDGRRQLRSTADSRRFVGPCCSWSRLVERGGRVPGSSGQAGCPGRTGRPGARVARGRKARRRQTQAVRVAAGQSEGPRRARAGRGAAAGES